MINVYHLVYNKFFRVHYPFKDTDKIRNIMVIDTKNKLPAQTMGFVETGYQLLQVKPQNIHFANFKSGLYNKLNTIFSQYPPHVVIVAKFLDVPIREILLSKGCKIIFINHGLLTPVLGKQILTTWDVEAARKYHRYVCTKSEIPYYIGAKVPSDKIFQINGSPQLDYFFQLDMGKMKQKIMSHISESTGDLTNFCKDPIDPNKKVVLLIENSGGVAQAHKGTTPVMTMVEYCKMVTTMIEMSDKYNFHIISKIKNGVFENQNIKELHKHKRVTGIDGFLSEGVTLYHVLFADLIFIQNSSTSFNECILINPNTIEFHIDYFNDNMNIKDYGLFMAEGLDSIRQYVDKFFTNTLLTPEYEANRQKFIDAKYGSLDKTTIQTIYNDILDF